MLVIPQNNQGFLKNIKEKLCNDGAKDVQIKTL